MGELIKAIPKASGARTDLQPISSRCERLKSEAIKESGISQRQADKAGAFLVKSWSEQISQEGGDDT